MSSLFPARSSRFRLSSRLLWVAGLAIAAPVSAQNAADARSFSIGPGPLAQVLNQFSAEAGVFVASSGELTQGKLSAGLVGRYGVEQGLETLLRGTGLHAVTRSQGAYVLQPILQPAQQPAVSGAANGVTRLTPVAVTASQERPDGPLLGLVATRSATATKTDTPIIETPQSISVVGASQIRDQKAQSLQEALGYTSGLMSGIVAKSSMFEDTMSIRGFEANPQTGSYYRDGMRYMINQYNGKQEPYGLERIEVLKGPSSVLYGAAAPGGIVNTVSKRPTSERLREINVDAGSFSRRQLSADFGGPLDDEGVWSYRLTGLVRDARQFVDHSRDDRTYLAPALTWRPSAATSLTLLAAYQRSESVYPTAVPVTGSLRSNPNGQIARERFLGEPNHNTFELESTSASLLFEHAFSDSLKIRQSVRQYNADLNLRYVLLQGDVDRATQRRVARSARGFDDTTGVFTSDTNIEKRFQTGRVTQTVLAGMDYTRSTYDSDRLRGNLPAIDIYNPVYQNGTVTALPWQQRRNKEARLGFYLQDQIKIDDKLVILVGGRRDQVRAENRALHAPSTDSNEKDSAFTGRAGVVYLADNGFAPYASFSQSFEPTSGRDRNETRFDPSRGQQVEVGVRYQPKESDTLLSASVFDLTRKNVLSPDAVDPTFLVQTGKVRSRGAEFEARARVTRELDVIAAYTYTDAKVRASNVPGEVGERFNTPRHMASLWADVNLSSAGLPGWRTGMGIRYVAARPDRPASGSFGGPGYTLLDARLEYENGPWSYALNISNLTDKTYIPSICYNNVCDYGEPRRIIGTVSYRW
ncbi:TonB-dependent siderophore receptor [Pigmentiphaga aceris]|uniref:TonB-dependent siderophore receptor n=1 Tax=Pigmentiphaga aceris TaxID=1940612 RepID=A0A5C0AXJ6_9BURK|nr:TonB-dependent siderophore receptor [Pigmentiphaga aceris]QEI05371.1 TonB-dependent siderophore receptor [Pigmentiphaga aceris]